MIGIRKSVTLATLFVSSFPFAGMASAPPPAERPASRPERSAFELAGQSEGKTPFDTAMALRNEAAIEEHEFVRRFNSLMNALRNFADTYNAGRVIDVKKAKAVRKALRDLENSEWFNPRKAE